MNISEFLVTNFYDVSVPCFSTLFLTVYVSFSRVTFKMQKKVQILKFILNFISVTFKIGQLKKIKAQKIRWKKNI